MRNLSGDIRYAIRGFRQAPVFTLTAILTLAIGIGGTTGIFSLIHAVMLRSLPVANPSSLYRVGDGNNCCVNGGPQGRWGLYSYPLFERLKAAAPEFEQLAAFQATTGRVSVRREGANGIPRPLRSEFVSGNYFTTFGIQPFAGRLFSASDDAPSAPPTAVLSYNVWQEHYGGDPSVVGTTFVVDSHAFTIAGIAPPGFYGETLRADPPEMWIPLQQEPLLANENSLLRQEVGAWLRAIGRLKPGATVDGMSARLTALLRNYLQHDYPIPAAFIPEVVRVLPKQSITVVPAGSGVDIMKRDYASSLQILMAVCGLVLLIACGNLANLLMARGMARRTQTSVRLAIGASRATLIRQSLVECVLIAIAGGIAGLAVAYGAQRLILMLAFRSSRSIPIDSTPSLAALLFAFGIALATALIFGAAPAWMAARTDPVEALRGSGRSTHDSSGRARTLLLVMQAALSVVLVAGATMLARSLGNLENQRLGFDTRHRLTISFNPPPPSYSIERLDATYRRLEASMREIPGVENSSLALYNPFTDNWSEVVFVEGKPAPKIAEDAVSSWDRVSASYFEAVGHTVLRGRGLTQADRAHTELVAVVNEAFVRRFFPGEDPLDKRFGMDGPENANKFRIVGVIADAKYQSPNEPANPMFFVPLAQNTPYDVEVLNRVELGSHFMKSALVVTNAPPGSMEPVLRRAFAEVDANLTINSVRTMKEQVAMSFDRQRAVAGLAGLFGVVALILAAVGLYGVTAYSVVQRTGEIGVRMALGADKIGVVRLILKSAFRKVAVGLALGIPLSVVAGKLISSQLYGVLSWDPWSMALAAGALALCALLAAIIPAARASGIDPMRALRTE
jgi:predicted permease